MQADSENTTNNSEIPYGFCHCGCGQKTKTAKETSLKHSRIKGQLLRFVRGHNSRVYHVKDFLINYHGYRLIHLPRHHKADRDGYVREHIVIVEKVLGKSLPPGVEVHHHNGKRADNAHPNLVVCQNMAYHHFIERRTRAFNTCGNANWRRCNYCKEYDDPANLHIDEAPRSGVYHLECRAQYVKTWYENRKRAKLSSLLMV
ncbi:MAG: HNH endonuclease [Syntrophobacteraceae bacterium]